MLIITCTANAILGRHELDALDLDDDGRSEATPLLTPKCVALPGIPRPHVSCHELLGLPQLMPLRNSGFALVGLQEAAHHVCGWDRARFELPVDAAFPLGEAEPDQLAHRDVFCPVHVWMMPFSSCGDEDAFVTELGLSLDFARTAGAEQCHAEESY